MTRIAKWALIIVFTALVIMFIYRHFFEFKNAEVKRLLTQEASRYKGAEATAYKILHDAANHILSNRTLTNQVRAYASKSGMSKERVLVDAAVAQAKAYKYIA